MERQKIDRSRTIVTFDNQILEAHKIYDTIKSQIEKFVQQEKEIPRHLITLSIEAQKYITSLNEKKGTFLMQPVIDYALREKLSDMMKSGNLRQGS